jgi:hypothetical protein
MNGHFKLTIAGEVFARGTFEEMIKVQNMHRGKGGTGKETKTTNATMSIDNDPREYPFTGKDEIKIIQNYPSGKVWGPFK